MPQPHADCSGRRRCVLCDSEQGTCPFNLGAPLTANNGPSAYAWLPCHLSQIPPHTLFCLSSLDLMSIRGLIVRQRQQIAPGKQDVPVRRVDGPPWLLCLPAYAYLWVGCESGCVPQCSGLASRAVEDLCVTRSWTACHLAPLRPLLARWTI